FSSFRGTHCQSLSPWKNIFKINVIRKSSMIFVRITANSFLYHMVRNIVGSLIEIGTSKKPISWMHELLQKKNRKYAGPTVTSKGLYLLNVTYPSFFN
ncbi:MAG: tRNA pseudouridine(38-40) synthase TruA, partial [Buchnera aphidicola]|nr:tRNA pseudouridine(38-40) synthase TruA [Buchnera aphidicola]MDE5285956.1 tRNA pseudouridine(38-40) synthase TruA [Buchnera aphidicola]